MAELTSWRLPKNTFLDVDLLIVEGAGEVGLQEAWK